jgi:ribosomal protein S18 acetylase RimI-like enzyme
MNIKYREGSTNRLEEIVSLNHTIFSGMYQEEPYSLEQYQNKLKDKEPKIFLAKSKRGVVGDSIGFGRQNSWYIWVMGVSRDCRGEGIGAKLLELNEKHALEYGFRTVSLKVYNVSTEMQRLLISRNYRISGVDVSNRDPDYFAVEFKLKL